jgi:hypothetical protein
LEVGPDSVILVRAPKNMIHAVDPPGQAADLPEGMELFKVPLAHQQEPVLKVETLNPVLRSDAGKAVATLSIPVIIGTLLAILVAAVLAAFKDRIKQALGERLGTKPTAVVEAAPSPVARGNSRPARERQTEKRRRRR